jgi:hypothetical protein
MSNVNILYTGNDTVLEVKGLKDEVGGDFLNAATVTATLVDAEGDQVAGETWPKTLTYVLSSDGVYRATLPYTMGLTAGGRYVAQVSVNAGAGLRASFALPCVARARV